MATGDLGRNGEAKAHAASVARSVAFAAQETLTNAGNQGVVQHLAVIGHADADAA